MSNDEFENFKRDFETPPTWADADKIPIKGTNGQRDAEAEIDIPLVHVAGSFELEPLRAKLATGKLLGPFIPFAGKPRTELFPNIKPFADFVGERWAIYHRRKAGQPFPWSDDPIFQRWSFCNMARSLDRVTAWIWDNWQLPHKDDPYQGFAMTVARLINRPETLQAIGYPVPWRPDHFVSVMDGLPKSGRYGSAYVVPALKDDRPKHVSHAERIFTPIYNNWEQLRPREGGTVAEFVKRMEPYPVMGGGFILAQVVADTKRVWPLSEAPDAFTFALSGPGSRIGLNYVIGHEGKAKWQEHEWYQQLSELHAIITPIYTERGLPIPDFQDTQNQLCEFHKYYSIVVGDKERLKREYRPAGQGQVEPPTRDKKASKTRAKQQVVIEKPSVELPAPEQPVAAPVEPITKYNPVTHPLPADVADREEACRFLRLLDPSTDRFTFQTFDDNHDRKDPELTRIIHGTLDQHFDRLSLLNANGAGVFVTVNETNFKGRKAPNIVRVRKFCADFDGGKPLPQDAPPWQMVVQTSATGKHVYWQVEKVTLEAFTPTQKAIAERWGSDPNASLLPQVMRLPGFFHQKIKHGVASPPFRTRIIEIRENAPPCSAEDFAVAPAEETSGDAELLDLMAADEGLGVEPTKLPSLAELRAAVAAIPNGPETDRAQWIRIGMAIRHECGSSDAGFAIFDGWSKKWPGNAEGAVYDAAKTETAWKKLKPRGEVTFGTLVHLADEADPGWRDNIEEEEPKPKPEADTKSAKDGKAKQTDLDEWDAGEVLSGELPPPRQWLTARQFCRGFVSSLVAPGGVGKTTFRLTQAIELATGRSLLGWPIHQRCRVLVVCFEDDKHELHRRLLAICRHHKIDPAELRGWLFCRELRGIKLAELVGRGARATRQVGALDGMLRRAIARGKYDLVILDPFVKLHALQENDNSDMEFVSSLLLAIAHECNIAVDSPAHTHKGEIKAGDADARRGGSAQRDADRLDFTLTVMTKEEAKQFGINPDDRTDYARLDSAKVNICRAIRAQWFRLVSVRLGNASETYPEGDEVQAIERWGPAPVWAGADGKALGSAVLDAILDDIETGLADGRRYSDSATAKDRAAWRAVQKHCPEKPEAQCQEMIKQWIKTEVLVSKTYYDKMERKSRIWLRLNKAARGEAAK
jgi:RecA-family ATPase